MWLTVGGQESLAGFYQTLSADRKAAIESVAVDMRPAYIRATLEDIPETREGIAFDKFHVAKYPGDAVSKVRRREHRVLLAEGRDDLTRTKHHWLMNPQNMSLKQWRGFKTLGESTLKTARAWAVRRRLEPVKKVARMIKNHLSGTINAMALKADNGGAPLCQDSCRVK